MNFTEIVQAQLGDMFRAALILALLYTMLRTRAVTGTWLPLAAGIVFVAVIIPMRLPSVIAAPLWMQVGAGLVSNSVLAGIGLGVWTLLSRLKG